MTARRESRERGADVSTYDREIRRCAAEIGRLMEELK